ncbi:MAG TPA: M20/M25/M40 family metallo-hydrolase [Candidatus Acidoferrales bacterium]|nr:M20/M25/M40 family metallo-hydrolase [Candidatus Acidoferrales bacterium]
MASTPGIRLLALAAALAAATLGLAGAGGGAPPGPADDGTLPALTAIAGQAMMNSQASPDLEYLSDFIGARVTGSPQAHQAVEWAEGRMKAMGLEDVHAETYQLWRGWTRGTATAAIVSPVEQRLMVDSMGWVGSTPEGGVEADVVPVNMFELGSEMERNTANWAGKVLIMVRKGEPQRGGPDPFLAFGAFLKAAYAAHALAVIGGQGGGASAGMHLTHTGILGFSQYYDVPVATMSVEGQDEIERLLELGKTVRVRIDVQNKVSSGPVEAENAVGEIRGAEHPEQVIVVGAHLDSWDLAEGTTDNGVGSACVLEAARAIVSSGRKPRRTIRFVLFTGEEQGLLGSFAYVSRHKGEMANHVAMLTLDNGQGPVTSLDMGGHADLIPAMEPFTAAIASFGHLRVDDEASFDTDTGPFILEGLPGINLGQNSPEYRYTHHSNVDTYDKVKTEALDQDSAVLALAAYWIADRPERLATPWPPERTARMLVEQHQDALLKAFGLWPFGNMGGENQP